MMRNASSNLFEVAPRSDSDTYRNRLIRARITRDKVNREFIANDNLLMGR